MSVPYVKLSTRHAHVDTPHASQSHHVLNKTCHLLTFLFLFGFPVSVKAVIINESLNKYPGSHSGCFASHIHLSQIQEFLLQTILWMCPFPSTLTTSAYSRPSCFPN